MNKKECPFCGELIQSGALKCRYCREWLDEDAQPKIEKAEAILRQEATVPSTPTAIKQAVEGIKDEIKKTTQVKATEEESLSLDEVIEILVEDNKAEEKEKSKPEPKQAKEKTKVKEKTQTETKKEELEEPQTEQLETVVLEVDASYSASLEVEELQEEKPVVKEEEVKPEPKPIAIQKEESIAIPKEKVVVEPILKVEEPIFISSEPIEQPIARSEPIREPEPQPIFQPTANNYDTYTEPVFEQEVEEKVYLIKWQSFKKFQLVATLVFLLNCASAYFLFVDIRGDELTIRSLGSIFAALSVNTYLLSQLNTYLRNFELSDLMQKAMKWLIGSYVLSAVSTVLFFYLYVYMQMIVILLPITCIGVIAILRLVIGWELWQKTYDYVGGLGNFGAFTLFSVLLPGLGVFTPLSLIKVFGDAQEHIDDFGTAEETEDDSYY